MTQPTWIETKETALRTLSKRQRTLDYWAPFDQSGAPLACPHCQNPLHLSETSTSLICDQGHTWDWSRQGSVHLANKSYASKYDRDLFQARRQVIMEEDFFAPLYELLGPLVVEGLQEAPGALLDAGSGEGSHLYRLLTQDSLRELQDSRPSLAFDLSSAGVKLATDYNGWFLNAVGDLAQLPLVDGSLAVILSILSPANYTSFARSLHPQGIMIKVLPGSTYLQEIRQGMQSLGHDLAPYSNQEVKDLLVQAWGPPLASHRIQARRPMTQSAKEALLAMTPMTWQLGAEEGQDLLASLPDHMTLDLEILVSQPSQKNH